ncbi:hypothetical protein ARMGADRAFT_771772 [Armillaria gallica]|uniref:Uncharacterized protein n=1 Tax=Armillaria gallica TaxID=47427 RepID=A0A2H3CFL1_ARMGA|nr:hypothetical protein ARMGADRAFT_771772 [Armillaria gallica]
MCGSSSTLGPQHRLFSWEREVQKPALYDTPSGIIVAELLVFPLTYLTYLLVVMASEGCVSHSPTYTNDPLNSSPEEYQSGESPMVWNVNGTSSEYGLGMTPGTYLPPSTYHPNLFGQASTDSFPIYYGANGEIMPDQRRHTSTIVLDHRELTNIGHSAFQDSYVAAQSVRCIVDPDLLSSMGAQRLPSQPLRNDLDELLLLSSYLSYPQVPLSLHSNDPGPSDLQDWFSSIDGGSDDTWFSSFIFGGLDNSFGAENPSAPGHYSMESTNCAQPGSYSLIDFLTSAPGTNNVP